MTYKLKPMSDDKFVRLLNKIRRTAKKTGMRVVEIAEEPEDCRTYITLRPITQSGGNAQ